MKGNVHRFPHRLPQSSLTSEEARSFSALARITAKIADLTSSRVFSILQIQASLYLFLHKSTKEIRGLSNWLPEAKSSLQNLYMEPKVFLTGTNALPVQALSKKDLETFNSFHTLQPLRLHDNFVLLLLVSPSL